LRFEGHNLVYFGPEPWDGLWRNRHQLLSVFARKNKVLYVEPRVHLRPTLRTMWRERRLGSQRPLCEQVQSNLYVFRPPRLAPVSGNRLVGALTRSVRHRLLRETLRRLEMDEPIAWFSRPDMADLLGVCQERLSIYHVVDEYAAYGHKTQAQKQRVHTAERRMLAKVDMVIVVSPPLLTAKRRYNPNTYLVPNAVNYEAFKQAMSDTGPLPPDVARLPRPIIGYSGLISGRLDLELLADIAQKHPHWSLALVGVAKDQKCQGTMKQLRALSNVHFLGYRAVDRVPYYIKAFDVGLIPYRTGEEAIHINPLKLYDYLACGKPVVSVDIPSVHPFVEVVYIAKDKETFTRCIEDALRENGDLASRRLDIAKQNTWEARVEQLSDHIQQTLHIKGLGIKRKANDVAREKR
jgi:glycosyltransferase involved in cell wall biosynthesis